jgi:hypothetical protein
MRLPIVQFPRIVAENLAYFAPRLSQNSSYNSSTFYQDRSDQIIQGGHNPLLLRPNL